MNTWKIFLNAFKSLSLRNIGRLLKLSLSNPFFAVTTFYASVKAFTLAKKYYPRSSSTSGRGNAFRHALWVCLILQYGCKIHSPEKALIWCKTITDLHEDLFQNPPLERKMDTHNNQVGMNLFKEMLSGIHRQFFETSFFVEKLKPMAEKAVLINSLNFDARGQLVFLEKSENL